MLVVEDDARLRRALAKNLEARGYFVDQAAAGDEALDRAAYVLPDAVVLDLGLPGLDGIEVIRSLRAWSQVPVVVVSARTERTDVIEALDAGADDYVMKPFAVPELLARVRVALRRPGAWRAHVRVDADDLAIDLDARRAVRDVRAVRLTATEWALVELLVRNKGRLIRQEQLLREVWGPDHVDHPELLWVRLARIRRKLERDPSQPRHFLTEIGCGYRFEA